MADDVSFWRIYEPFKACSFYNYAGAFIFFLLTLKSIYDLIVSEFYYRDTPLLKVTYRKFFHFLLPFSQGFYCASCIIYSMYCLDIKDQHLPTVLLTSGGGYILVLCFLMNALHWAFLTTQSNLKLVGCIVGGTLIVFVVTPIAFEFLFVAYFLNKDDNILRVIHIVELFFAFVLNIAVSIIVGFSWYILHRKLREFSGLNTINKLKKRLMVQMLLYITFFVIRAICLLTGGLMGFFARNEDTEDGVKYSTNKITRLTLFFVSNIFGDVPLSFVMLYYLQHKGVPAKAAGSASGAGPGGGGQVSIQQASYQYPTAGKGAGDNSQAQRLYNSNGYSQPSDIIFTSTPPQFYDSGLAGPAGGYPQNAPYYYSPESPGMDPTLSTNSYYTQDQDGTGYV